MHERSPYFGINDDMNPWWHPCTCSASNTMQSTCKLQLRSCAITRPASTFLNQTLVSLPPALCAPQSKRLCKRRWRVEVDIVSVRSHPEDKHKLITWWKGIKKLESKNALWFILQAIASPRISCAHGPIPKNGFYSPSSAYNPWNTPQRKLLWGLNHPNPLSHLENHEVEVFISVRA